MTGPGRQLDVHVRRHGVDARLVVPLRDGGVTVLFGPSGAGKSTVLRAVAGLDRTCGGHVRVGSDVWDDGHGHVVPARRRRVGLLFQDAALFPHLDVEANVGYGLHRLPRAERPGRAREALRAAGAGHLLGRGVSGLSGGEAQRVALARALAPRPGLLLLDEPLSALDSPTRVRLRGDLRSLLVAERLPALVVTHDRSEALALADRVAVLVDGAVRQVAAPAEVFARPADVDVARAVGVDTVVPGAVTGAAAGGVTVRVGGVVVRADRTRPWSAGAPVWVCLRAEEVVLAAPGGAPPPGGLPVVVTAVTPEGPVLRVDLQADGCRLAAYVVRPVQEALGVVPGARLVARVDPAAVHLVPRGARD